MRRSIVPLIVALPLVLAACSDQPTQDAPTAASASSAASDTASDDIASLSASQSALSASATVSAPAVVPTPAPTLTEAVSVPHEPVKSVSVPPDAPPAPVAFGQKVTVANFAVTLDAPAAAHADGDTMADSMGAKVKDYSTIKVTLTNNSTTTVQRMMVALAPTTNGKGVPSVYDTAKVEVPTETIEPGQTLTWTERLNVSPSAPLIVSVHVQYQTIGVFTKS